MREDLQVPVEKLRKVLGPENFALENTSQVEPAKGFIGQERAVQAIRMGLEITAYHIYIASHTSVSRESVLLEYLNKYAEEKAAADGGNIKLRDFCYVYNFEKNDRPKILIFIKGEGKKFRNDIANLLNELRNSIPLILKSDECIKPTQEILKKLEKNLRGHFDKFQKNLSEAGFMLIQTPAGFMVRAVSRQPLPGQGNVPMPQEEYNRLSQAEKDDLTEAERQFIEDLNKVLPRMQDLRKDAQEEIEKFEEDLVGKYLKRIFKGLKKRHSTYPEVLDYFKGLKEYTLSIMDLFREKNNHNHNGEQNGLDPFLPFRVNLFVDNSNTNKIPVIFEENPNFGNLFGRIDKFPVQGALLTDHTRIKAGSLALAEGGYLVLNFLDAFLNTGVWEKLKKTVKYDFLKIDDPLSYFGWVPTNLNPEPMPIQLKVILVGDPMFYPLLVQYDNDFSAIFNIKAELDSEMPSTPENEMAYAAFIAACCSKKDLRLSFDRSGIVKVVEYGYRLADRQTKLSTEFHKISDLVVESNYWAEKAGSSMVKAEHVQKALEVQKLRKNLHEEKLQEYIVDGIFLIDIEGEEVGQINGLAVYDLGNYRFGKPSRITANTFLGESGVVSIQREVKLSGPIHDTGVLILRGYFGKKYGQDNPLSFSASLCFEQCYDGVEGDSASAAELVCLISSLSELPIGQNWAMTGSVNQKGEIQPIGGVNEKIEGFFDVCKEKGLTDSQGVIIPHQNVANLMLREDVVEVCRQGKFRVCAVKTIDQALELLMNRPAETVHQKVAIRLAEMAEKMKANKKSKRK